MGNKTLKHRKRKGKTMKKMGGGMKIPSFTKSALRQIGVDFTEKDRDNRLMNKLKKTKKHIKSLHDYLNDEENSAYNIPGSKEKNSPYNKYVYVNKKIEKILHDYDEIIANVKDNQYELVR